MSACLLFPPAPARAQAALDTPGLTVVSIGHGKVRLRITAGPSGTPGGFAISWMRAEELAARGGVWAEYGSSEIARASFTGVATLHTWGEGERSFRLGPNESLDTEIGDLADETGVSGIIVGELAGGLEYVFRVNANGTETAAPSSFSPTSAGVTTFQGHDCTYTQGYWKTHPTTWPVDGLTLGSVYYSKAQLLQMLIGWSVKGNGLVSLAHQLIATKLNVAQGSNPMEAGDAIVAADALIGPLVVPPIGSGSLEPSETSDLTQILDDYNNGVSGPGHCDPVPVAPQSWGRLKSLYR